MPLPIKFNDQFLKRVGYVWSSCALVIKQEEMWNILMGHRRNGTEEKERAKKRERQEKSSVKSLLLENKER